jgi:hypothetical protein
MGKRFRIAFSFAGDKRAFVAEAAGILARRFSQQRILYDKYHQAEFARGDLAFHLPALYHEHSDLVVAVLCNDYDTKEWCGLEWDAIYGLLKQRKADEVMLCRFDRVQGKGLYGLAGFVDLDDMAPSDFARLIAERLAVNEGQSMDYYTRDEDPGGLDWPVAAPLLEWPVADHTEARGAFSKLITRAAPFRVLPIHGRSETGKSHLTNQFLRNALKIPGLTCGRFDFKGSSDMDAELNAFADRLGVPAPTPGTVSGQLAQVFGAVKRTARPTLLIFDTFERAGDAERWVKDNLLLSIITATWLRVVIVGQRVPLPPGEPWAADSSPPIELRPPTPEEWFAYGQPHNSSPEFTIEFVRSAHAFVKGKSSVLAQLCGPAA